MKMFRIILCFLIIFSLVSCSKNELMDISGFIDNYNNISPDDISFSDFVIQKKADTLYTADLSKDGIDILISINQGSDHKIKSCKVALIKDDSNMLTKEDVQCFYKEVIKVISAYCNYDEQTSIAIADDFQLSHNDTISKLGELTLNRDNFCFVYYSTQIISQFTVYNTYIEKVKVTEKPVSKPYFGEDIIIKDKETP